MSSNADALSHLNKLVNPVTGSSKQLTVENLVAVLQRFPKDAKVYILDTQEDYDVPMKESNILSNEENTEVFFDIPR